MTEHGWQRVARRDPQAFSSTPSGWVAVVNARRTAPVARSTSVTEPRNRTGWKHPPLDSSWAEKASHCGLATRDTAWVTVASSGSIVDAPELSCRRREVIDGAIVQPVRPHGRRYARLVQ